DTINVTSNSVSTTVGGLGGGDTYTVRHSGMVAGLTVSDTGGAGTDTVTLNRAGAGPETITITSASVTRTASGAVSYSGIEALNVSATAADDTINVNSTAVTTNVFGGAGADTFNVNASVSANLNGEAGADVFNFANGAVLTGTLSGGTESDTLNLSAYVIATDVTLTVSAADGYSGTTPATTFDTIDALTGGPNSTLTGIAASAATWTTSNTNAGTYLSGANTLTFSSFANWVGGGNVDTFNLGHNVASVSGGAGNDVFNVNASVSSTLSGGTNDDSFNFANGSVLTGTVDGGAGIDTLNFSAYTTALTINLNSAGGTDGANGATAGTPNPLGGGFSNIDAVTGGSGGNTFNVNASVTANLTGGSG